MDGGLWHHLNGKEIRPTQGLCSEWMKFQSRNSCSGGEGRTHFCINSPGRSNSRGWWVKQAVTADLSLVNDLFQRPSTEAIFLRPSQTMSAFQPGEFTCIAKTRSVPSFLKLCSRDKGAMLWLPALQLLVLRNLFCSFESLYHTAFS